MPELWNIRAEITVQPEDFPGGDTNGFMNILIWAESAEAAQQKIATYFERFDWHIVGVEEAIVLSADFVADNEEVQDRIDRARNNPEAIICSTFHSYKSN
jgi:hypothetical protein